jgi:DNA-directed RNA polymerase subunit RPC12/RpoP
MENYKEKSEQLLLEMANQKEENDKKLLQMEILTGVLCLLPLLMAIILVSVVPMEEWLGGIIAGMSCIPLFIAVPFMIKIEQTAGYYKCGECGHKYVPTFWSVFWAIHVGRTRYMKCPECQKRSWNKKVLTKD